MKQAKKNKGMMGIGTLIIFIAVILVAAVAAAVLVATSGSLQQRSLETGQQTEQGVTTGAEAISVMASDASSDHSIDNFEMMIRLQAGSESMNFNNTVLVMDTSSTSQNLVYSGNTTNTGTATGTSDYKIYYIKQGPDYENGYLSRGDIIKLVFTSNGAVTENKKVRLKVIPRVGTTTIVEFTTPDVMKDQRISLWPI